MAFSFPRDFDIDGTPANEFPECAFDSIKFPYSDLQVRGGIRHAVHEFPHSPGAEIEKMGRKPYEITISAWFHDVPGSALERAYPNLYASLSELRSKFEAELSGPLDIPTIGTMQCVATSWTLRFDPRSPSGQTVELSFIEDFDINALAEHIGDVPSEAALTSAADDLAAQAALNDALRADTVSIFQKISDAVTEVQGVLGRADAYSRLVEGKIRAVENLCSFASDSLQDMQDPVNHLVLDALKDLWLASRELADNVIQSRQPVREYVVGQRMTVGQIAVKLYGTTEKTVDLLQMNAFDDALNIPAGTVVKYLVFES